MRKTSNRGNCRICLWKYKENVKNYPGYHIAADPGGVRFLEESLSRLQPRHRKSVVVPLSQPTPTLLVVPNNLYGKAAFRAFAKCEIVMKSTEESVLQFTEAGEDIFRILLSPRQLAEFQGALMFLQRREEWDIRATDSNEPLNFWWHPE